MRPQRACLCIYARPVTHQVQVLLLQHPLEVGHAKNTARLLHLCLSNSQIIVGEAFEQNALQRLLYQPWAGDSLSATVHPILLYPPTPSDPAHPVGQPPPLPAHYLATPERIRLIVLDGTWRKSRKMMHLNSALHNLPRLHLQDIPAQGNYIIRKAHLPGQLSTFEATALALSQLENWADNHPSKQQLTQTFQSAMRLHQQLRQH